jgi:hypothetical protein
MNQATHSIGKSMICMASAMITVIPVFAQAKDAVRQETNPEPRSQAVRQAREERLLVGRDRVAKEQYETRAAEIALRSDEAAAVSRENAALLYHHALLAYREPDPCTAQILNAVSRGGVRISLSAHPRDY